MVQEIHKLGHLGVNKVQSAVVESYFWRGMHDDIREVIRKCPCAANKQRITVMEPLRPTQLPLQAFDPVAIDLMSLTKSVNGNRYIVAAQDYLTKWPEAKAIPHKSAADVA